MDSTLEFLLDIAENDLQREIIKTVRGCETEEEIIQKLIAYLERGSQ